MILGSQKTSFGEKKSDIEARNGVAVKKLRILR